MHAQGALSMWLNLWGGSRAHGKVKKLLMSYFEYEPSGIDEMEIVPFYLNIAVLRSGKVLSPRILRLMSEHT